MPRVISSQSSFRQSRVTSKPEKRNNSMQEYDLYINPKKPSIGLYVRKGAGLPDLADASEWLYDGSANDVDLPSDLVQNIESTGHAFRELD
jgi:hypothetical protein